MTACWQCGGTYFKFQDFFLCHSDYCLSRGVIFNIVYCSTMICLTILGYIRETEGNGPEVACHMNEGATGTSLKYYYIRKGKDITLQHTAQPPGHTSLFHHTTLTTRCALGCTAGIGDVELFINVQYM